jgi:hypothetical protein
VIVTEECPMYVHKAFAFTPAAIIRRFGVRGVYETAKIHLPTAELIQLNAELQRVEGVQQQGRRFKRTTKRKRLSLEQQLRAVEMYVREDGPSERIATHLGVSVSTVEKRRRQLREQALERSQSSSDALEPAKTSG